MWQTPECIFLLHEQFRLNFSKVCEDQGCRSWENSSGQSVCICILFPHLGVWGKPCCWTCPFWIRSLLKHFFCLETPVGGLCKWQPYEQSITKTEGQFPVPLSGSIWRRKPCPLVPCISWSGQSQGYLGILECEWVRFLMFVGPNVG